MELLFCKYSATGNDFIVVDNRDQKCPQESEVWEKMCRRRQGVGADGVLLLEKSETFDFSMGYLNADGKPAQMCGNGARAISHFAHHILKMNSDGLYRFDVYGSPYQSQVEAEEVALLFSQWKDEGKHSPTSGHLFNTGVPHLVIPHWPIDERFFSWRDDLDCNITFYQKLSKSHLRTQTYERGVDVPTLSCGTGVMAAFLYHSLSGEVKEAQVDTPGGQFILKSKDEGLWMKGDVEKVFSGVTRI